MFHINNFVSKLSSFWVMHSILAIKANQKYTFMLFDTLYAYESILTSYRNSYLWPFLSYFAQKFEFFFCA